jgi:hypothetical protein
MFGSTIRYPREFQTFVPLIYSQTCESIGLNSLRPSPIRILNDDVLLIIFHLYRLAYPDEYDDEVGQVFAWRRQRWWYKLAHVCRLWRNLILESPTRLDLHLYCTNGVPVADMIAHSPPLPLSIHYSVDGFAGREITAEDESGIFLALSQRDRVRRIRFWMLPNAGKFVTAMNDQFPSLERMYINSPIEVPVALPATFQAPNLRHLELRTAFIPVGSPLLTTTTAGLVTLSLLNILASAYFSPSYILSQLSLMLQLERLVIDFESLVQVPSRDVEGQLHQTLDITTLPNLRWFGFAGMRAYLEVLVARISAPLLNTLQVDLFGRPSCTDPRLSQFMQTSENLTISAVQITFGARTVLLHAVPWKWDTPLMLEIKCGCLDWQIASVMQFFGTLSPILSVVEHVTMFSYQEYSRSSAWYSNVDRRQWRELLRPFANAKTIRVQGYLVDKIFRSLLSDDGGTPLELLPNLEEVECSEGSDAQDALTTFLNERQVVGHPVSLRLVDRSMFDRPLIA